MTVSTPPHRDAGAVLLFYLAGQVLVLRQQHPRVLRDAPDSVHKMRVATRRLRSVLASYRTLLDRDRVAFLRRELRWLAGMLGMQRDAEVLAERLRDDLARLDAQSPDAGGVDLRPARERLDAWQAAVVPDAQASVAAALSSERYRRLADDLDDLLARPPFDAAATRPARAQMAAAMRADLRRLRRRVRRALDLPDGPARDTALHEARKRTKQLRYAAEAAVPARPTRAARLVAGARDLQECLGEHQDGVVARQLLTRLLTDARAENADTAGLDLLLRRETARAHDAERRFLQLWGALAPPGG